MHQLTFLTAFLAGLASFLSPCVLPLVPGYISYISGISLEDLSKGTDKGAAMRQAGWGSVFFVAGFALVFTLLGASASAAGRFLQSHTYEFSKIAGGIIIVFGLHIAGIAPIPWLYHEKRIQPGVFSSGFWGAFLMGFAFAFGWTPCIGPILSGILFLAAAQKTFYDGMLLLLLYSLGLGIPFVVTGFGINAFLWFFARYKRFIRAGEICAGLLLVVVGGLVFSNRLTMLIRLLPRSLYKFAL